jgi:hypothetical protein
VSSGKANHEYTASPPGIMTTDRNIVMTPSRYRLLSIIQRPRYEKAYETTQLVKPNIITGASGNAIERKPPA